METLYDWSLKRSGATMTISHKTPTGHGSISSIVNVDCTMSGITAHHKDGVTKYKLASFPLPPRKPA